MIHIHNIREIYVLLSLLGIKECQGMGLNERNNTFLSMNINEFHVEIVGNKPQIDSLTQTGFMPYEMKVDVGDVGQMTKVTISPLETAFTYQILPR